MLVSILIPLLMMLFGVSIQAGVYNPYGYKYVYLNQGSYDNVKLEGWSIENVCETPAYVLRNVDLSDIQLPVVDVWSRYFNRGNDKAKIFISNDSDVCDFEEYNQTILPKSVSAIAVAFDSTSENPLSAITIGTLGTRESNTDICNTLSYEVLKGNLVIESEEDYEMSPGIYPERDDKLRVAEIRITSPQMEELTHLHANIEYHCNFSIKNEKFEIIAVIPDGEIPVENIRIQDQYICMLPAHTQSILLRWSFQDDSENLDRMCIYGYDWESPEKFCIELFQPATPGFCSYSNRFFPVSDAAEWYDIDNDGILEWKDHNKLYKPGAGDKGALALSTKLPASFQSGADYRWITLPHDSGVGILGPYALYSLENNTLSEIYMGDNTYTIKEIDYDNDGSKDFWLSDLNDITRKVMILDKERNIFTEDLNILTPEEYYDYWSSPDGDGLGSAMSVVPGSISYDPGSFGDFEIVDINNDGYMDFIDPASGVYLLNTGNDSFVRNKFGGKILFRDLDGDGLNDLICQAEKEIMIYYPRKEGATEELTLYSGMECGKHIWPRDFDKDGDVDILVPFNEDQGDGYGYLLMFENTGSGRFKMHEYCIDRPVYFSVCTDVDGDGDYDVLAIEVDKKSNSIKGLRFSMRDIEISTEGERVFELKQNSNETIENGFVADIDNSGRLKWFSSFGFKDIGGFNARPDRPDAPEVEYDPVSGKVEISWNRGSDKETAPLDLTYELRIGTTPGGGDILHADALNDGRRKRISEGNCGYGLKRILDTSSWPEGDIYISLQVIDAEYQGSEFSDYTILHKKEQPVAFTISKKDVNPPSVYEEVILAISSRPSSAPKYEWDLDGGEYRRISDTEVAVSWVEPGIKKLRLVATSDSGIESELVREINVIPGKMHEAMGESEIKEYYVFDIDGDGVSEIYNGQKFFEGDADGNYTPLKKLFNSNLPYCSNPCIVDINMDGMPDIYGDKWHAINSGEKSMEIVEFAEASDGLTHDFDNDGFVDVSPRLRNSGDYRVFESTECTYNGNLFFDTDGDGMIDIFNLEDGIVYKNLGDFKFEGVKKFPEQTFYRFNSAIGDIDGDGYNDVAFCKSNFAFGVSHYEETVMLFWGDGEVSEIKSPAGHRYGIGTYLSDIDNNGTMDLIMPLDNEFAYTICFFSPDKSYRQVKCVGSLSSIHSRRYHRSDGVPMLGGMRIIGQPNTPPSIPENIRVNYEDKTVVLEWDSSVDAENPSTALRYNISIKRKGKDGDGAYFRSPLNFGCDGVPVSSESNLLSATKFTIPANVLPLGEYEVRVQAVDTQSEVSDFSKVFGFNYDGNHFGHISSEISECGNEYPLTLFYTGDANRYIVGGLSGSGSIAVLKVYDMNGINVFSGATDTETMMIDLGNSGPGAYILSVEREGTKRTLQFLIK